MSQTTPRCLSPTSQASGGLLKMLATQIRTEFLSNWRVPEFLIGVAAIPVMLFIFRAARRFLTPTTVA